MRPLVSRAHDAQRDERGTDRGFTVCVDRAVECDERLGPRTERQRPGR
jgi:hypothetical protein